MDRGLLSIMVPQEASDPQRGTLSVMQVCGWHTHNRGDVAVSDARAGMFNLPCSLPPSRCCCLHCCCSAPLALWLPGRQGHTAIAAQQGTRSTLRLASGWLLIRMLAALAAGQGCLWQVAGRGVAAGRGGAPAGAHHEACHSGHPLPCNLPRGRAWPG